MTIQQWLGPNGLLFYTEDEEGKVNIFWGGRLYYSFNRSDMLAKKIGIALFAELGVYRKTICDFFKISRRTITNILAIYKHEGFDGLKDYKPGPAAIEEELRAFVIKKYIELEGSRGYQKRILEAVAKKVKEGDFKKGISRSMLHKIIGKYKIKREEQKRNNLEEIKEREEDKADKIRHEVESNKNEKTDSKQIELISDISEGKEICVEHGGSLAAAIFLDKYGLKGAIPESYNDENRYSNHELAVTFALLNAGEIVKVEQDFEHLPSYEMGGIIGKNRLPSLSLYRKRIPEITRQMEMREVILETSKRVQKILSFSRVVYIDGHFMPYYGGEKTLHGYYPQKRLAMYGREYFFVHDRKGLPVYAAISDGYRKMKHYIVDVDEKLKEIYGVKEKELLEVFDRGGYSKEFCVNISNKIRFICWRSDARQVPTVKKWEEIIVEHQGNNYDEVRKRTFHAWEREVEFKAEEKEAKFREIWIRKGNKVSPALTNDFRLSPGEVVKALTRRWGAQENMFKELKEHGIDKIHSYRKEEYTETFLYKQGLEEPEKGIIREIDNPVIRAINKKLVPLRVKKRKIAERIIAFENNGNKKRLTAEKIKYSDIEREIKNQIKKRELLPKKINLLKRIKENDIVRLNDEKKLFFDWLKMNAIWAKREIIEIMKPDYQDMRDVNKFVKSILNSRTYVYKKEDKLYVEFPFQSSKKRHKVLQRLCNFLNGYGKIELGLDYHRLIFSVREKH